MARQHETKTNAMRLLDAAGIEYEMHVIEGATAQDSGVDIARMAGQDPAHVFKTLVTQGKTGEHYVFMVPVACELDLKKAAACAGEKSVQMVKARDLLGLTGYVHGGCSPLGMKRVFPTFADEACALFDTILFSAGRIGMQIEVPYGKLAQVLDVQLADLTALP